MRDPKISSSKVAYIVIIWGLDGLGYGYNCQPQSAKFSNTIPFLVTSLFYIYLYIMYIYVHTCTQCTLIHVCTHAHSAH